jgi:hypothetical protein
MCQSTLFKNPYIMNAQYCYVTLCEKLKSYNFYIQVANHIYLIFPHFRHVHNPAQYYYNRSPCLSIYEAS